MQSQSSPSPLFRDQKVTKPFDGTNQSATQDFAPKKTSETSFVLKISLMFAGTTHESFERTNSTFSTQSTPQGQSTQDPLHT
jgi:hypothetical protein